MGITKKSSKSKRKPEISDEASSITDIDSAKPRASTLGSRQDTLVSSSSDGSTSASDKATSAVSSNGSNKRNVSEDIAEESEDTQVQKSRGPAEFDEWYLRQLTKEFADDLDQLRKAPDFTEDSLPILIGLLKQCSSMYSDEQKRLVMNHDLKGLK